MSGSETQDAQALRELRRMAQLYLRLGREDKANELSGLAADIERRMAREANIVDLRRQSDDDTRHGAK